ncbi:MAG: uracil-xanthine permease [Oscillospiraceae bacterium]|nr:uracil-xanthine permease [Oscillospiraceae bacterium]
MSKQATASSEPIRDARALGAGKMLVLGIQHMFAMFGATILVPIITGLSVQVTLLCAGLGTLFFHLCTKFKVPAFLGSSFAFLGGFTAVKMLDTGIYANLTEAEKLPYACGGIVVAGLLYLVMAAVVRVVGIQRVMRFLPPVVTGPIIILIGLILAPSAVTNASDNWWLAALSVAVIIVCNMWGRGMIKIIPILMGVLIPYVVALCFGMIDFTEVAKAGVVGLPPFELAKFDLSAILIMAPIAIASMMEHIGDMSAIGATCGENYIEQPGLHRSLVGDGLATSLAALFGGPANTTYGENTGVLVLSRVYDPRVVRIAAYGAIILSFSPAFAEIIHSIPTAIIGGVSFVLYGMISAVGVRNVVENKVDFTNTRNLLIAAVILVSGLGFNGFGGLTFTIFGSSLTLTGLAIAAILGILLNAILPGKDYHFGEDLQGDTSVTFQSNVNK